MRSSARPRTAGPAPASPSSWSSPRGSAEPRAAGALSRRGLLRLGLATGGALIVAGALPGCDVRPDEAYEPWAFPLADVDAPELQLVAAALLAANPHDTQPWWFRATPAGIDVYLDPARSLGAMDGLRREAFIGLGCAIENAVHAAPAFGRSVQVELLPTPGDEAHVAHLALAPARAASSPLFAAIAERHTNRGPYLESAPPPGLEGELRRLVDDPRVELALLGDAAPKAAFRSATLEATRAIVADREMNEASHAWYRHDADAIREHRDGTTLDATGAAWITRALGSATARPSAETAGEYWIDATATRQATGAAVVLLSSAARDDRGDQLRVGRVYQRLHLWATSQGLAMQPLNQLPERQDREQALGLAPTFGAELARLAGQEVSRVQMACRIGYALDDARPSPRRPLAWVLRS